MLSYMRTTGCGCDVDPLQTEAVDVIEYTVEAHVRYDDGSPMTWKKLSDFDDGFEAMVYAQKYAEHEGVTTVVNAEGEVGARIAAYFFRDGTIEPMDWDDWEVS